MQLNFEFPTEPWATYRVVYQRESGELCHSYVSSPGITSCNKRLHEDMFDLIGTKEKYDVLQIISHPGEVLLWWKNDQYETKLEIA